MFFGRLEAHLCGWMENRKGCVLIQGGELCTNCASSRTTFFGGGIFADTEGGNCMMLWLMVAASLV